MPDHAMRQLCAHPDFATRNFGTPITDHRSSWVRRTELAGIRYYVKTYDYPRWTDRLRGWLRNTGPWTRSRAAVEFDAMVWLRNHGFATAEPLGALELRSVTSLRKAVLVTREHPGQPAHEKLADLAPAERVALAAAIGRTVAALHQAGFRDRNLDLRNLLAAPAGDGQFAIAKIDSPRFRLVAPGRAHDRWARADWQRLLRQLAPFGMATVAWHAAQPAWSLATLLGPAAAQP
ncbi:MAG: hypothetical protein JNK49_11780 [Planctomycetes bacterium]|nr:hypothetical protein [Planctomycetota bacterium]